MLKLSGNTKLQVRFVAWLTAFFIIIVLVFHVGLVEAASGESNDVDQLRASGPHIYDSVPDGYSTFSDSGFNMDFTNDSFNLSLNYTDLDIVDPSNPFSNYQGSYYGTSFPLVYFDDDLSNGEFFLPNTFTYNGSTYNISLFDSCYISSTGNSFNCVFYNKSDFQNSIFCNTSFYGLTNFTRAQYEQLDDSGKLSHSFVRFSCTLDTMLFSYYSFLTDKYLFSNPGSSGSSYYLATFSNAVNYSCLNIDSLYYDPNFNAQKHFGLVVDDDYHENLYDYNYLLQYYNSSGGNTSSENDLNNLFLNNAHWSFNIPKGNDSRGFPKSFLDNGKAVFSGLLNKYQSEHLDNFYFHYTFYIQPQYQQGTGSGESGGGGHPISILDAFRQNEITNNTTFFPPVFQFNLDGQTYYNQTMREFNSAGQSCTFFTTEYLFDNCYYQGDSFNDYIETWHFSNMTNCFLYCTAVMFSTGGGVSGTCQAWYDLCTGQSGVTSENMTINPDPYNPDSITPPNTTTTSGQFGNIIINNNNTLNGGSGLPIGSTATQQEQASFFKLFNPVKFFLGLLTGSNSSTGEELRQSLGVNNWLTIITTTFSFIPPSFINALGVFFVTSLGILIVALIFRVILDLL